MVITYRDKETKLILLKDYIDKLPEVGSEITIEDRTYTVKEVNEISLTQGEALVE